MSPEEIEEAKQMLESDPWIKVSRSHGKGTVTFEVLLKANKSHLKVFERPIDSQYSS